MENSKNKKKCYEVTYHFTNGEDKIIVYAVDLDKSKEDFVQFICCNFVNAADNKFISDEKFENIVNMNHVCFFEVSELTMKKVNENEFMGAFSG